MPASISYTSSTGYHLNAVSVARDVDLYQRGGYEVGYVRGCIIIVRAKGSNPANSEYQLFRKWERGSEWETVGEPMTLAELHAWDGRHSNIYASIRDAGLQVWLDTVPEPPGCIAAATVAGGTMPADIDTVYERHLGCPWHAAAA